MGASLLEKLKAGARNLRVIDFPGSDRKVGLRVLTNAESQAAFFAAAEHFEKRGVEIGADTIEAFEDEHTVQQLALALRDPDDPDTAFAKNADQLRALITRDEKSALVDEYTAFEQEVSPRAENLSEQELDELLDRLKKKPETLSILNTFTLRRLLAYSVGRPWN